MGFKEFKSLCDKDRNCLERLCQHRGQGGWREIVGAAHVTRVWNISSRPTGPCGDVSVIRAVGKFSNSLYQGMWMILPHSPSS